MAATGSVATALVVPSYSPDGADIYLYLIVVPWSHASLPQTASRFVGLADVPNARRPSHCVCCNRLHLYL